MSLLGGVFNPEADPAEIEIWLNRQLRALGEGHRLLQRFRYSAPGLALGYLDAGIFENGQQPVVSENGRFALILNGELFNCEELAKGLDPPEHYRRATPPEICLQHILTRGEAGLRRLNGQFVIALYDTHERRLQLISDRFGFRPLFYSGDSSRFVLASTLKGLRAGQRSAASVDQLGTTELFAYGTHVLDRSWVAGCLRLPPSTVMTISQGGIQLEKYWCYAFDESAEKLDQPTYFTVSAKLLDRAVEQRMRGSSRIGIFLSGGYDSRAVVAAIRRHHLPIPAFTFGVPESRDARFAAQLANRLGLEHELLHPTGPYLARYCRAISRGNDGILPFIENTSLVHHERIKAKADVILTGFLGDYSGSHTWPRLLLTRTRRQAMRVIFDRLMGERSAVCRRIFTRRLWDEVYEEIRTRFHDSFEELPNRHPQDLSDAWDFTYRHPWSYQAAAVDRPLFEVRAPMLDIDLTEFQLSMPWHARLEQRVYKKMIAYSYPEIREIPCTNSERPINPGFVREYMKMTLRFAGRRLVEPIRTRLTRSKPLGRELTDQAEEFRAEPELRSEILEPMLNDGTFDPSMFNVDAIRVLAREHYTRQGRHETVLARLISWGLAKRYLVDGESGGSEAPEHERL